MSTSQTSQKPPNILLITVDQMRYPCTRYEKGGMADPIKDILSFQDTDLSNNPYAKFFPGFQRLRRNAVAFHQHIIATSACVPSRATIYTGQYGTRTRVMETDSLYKYGSDPNFPWLHPRGIPTMGDWLRTAGYSTHYFGKWDLSYVDFDGYTHGDLNPWGFADWRLCTPDAQGGTLNELGVYRDPGYADLVCNFLSRQAMNYQDTPNDPKPWLCVASFVNPHDIASAYPINWWIPEGLKVGDSPVTGVQTATDQTPAQRPIPEKGAISNPLPGGRIGVPLNPQGFPQDTYELPVTLNEDLLATKPTCQFDYAYKMGMALKSRRPPEERPLQGMPFQLQDDPNAWFKSYGDFYAYTHTLADMQINRVLQTLDEMRLTEDTVVIFLGDHGEYGGAHGGMIEKWHTAYEEILHVPFLVSSPLINPDDKMREVNQLTSHIDVLPTILGLAGIDEAAREELGQQIEGKAYEPLPGANLTSVMKTPDQPIVLPNNETREGVLFITDDTITQYLRGEKAPLAFEVFLDEVEYQQKHGVELKDGSVTEPCHIRCVRTNDWKLARYWDPFGKVSDEWELYYLVGDLYEQYNLVSWENGEPVPEPGRLRPDWGVSEQQLAETLTSLRELLVKLEEEYLGGPRPVEEPYTIEG